MPWGFAKARPFSGSSRAGELWDSSAHPPASIHCHTTFVADAYMCRKCALHSQCSLRPPPLMALFAASFLCLWFPLRKSREEKTVNLRVSLALGSRRVPSSAPAAKAPIQPQVTGGGGADPLASACKPEYTFLFSGLFSQLLACARLQHHEVGGKQLPPRSNGPF